MCLVYIQFWLFRDDERFESEIFFILSLHRMKLLLVAFDAIFFFHIVSRAKKVAVITLIACEEGE